jgi:hypothetical protein
VANVTVAFLSKEERDRGRYFINNTADRAWQQWMLDLAFTADHLERALRAMMDEHTALGIHDSGEIEYCSRPACAAAVRLLDGSAKTPSGGQE